MNPSGPGESRAELLRRVRAALGRPTPDARAVVSPIIPDDLVRTTGPREDLASLFTERATAAGMNVRACAMPQLGACLSKLWGELGAERAAIGIGDTTIKSAVLDSLHGGRTSVVDWERGGFGALYGAEIGITDGAAAVAETGSLVMSSGSARGRGVFLVPPIHVAIVRVSRIVPDLVDCWPISGSRDPGTMPTSVVLVSGPSKTADIEGILITGVHGPGQVHVVLVDDGAVSRGAGSP